MLRDIKPGEMVIIEDGKIIDERMYAEPRAKGICIFEYVYFARTDSVIDGLSVYEARCNMGRVLAKEHPVITSYSIHYTKLYEFPALATETRRRS